MATIPVIVKHQGKKYDIDLDPSSLGEVFKFQLYSLTGVEPDRQKILVKGGQLKDDTDLSKIGAKPGQTFMMMGTASGAGDLQRPKEAIRFVEDMTAAEAAQQVGATPAGLQNLGNTCYLNSALQTLRTIPELQQELMKYTVGPPIRRHNPSLFGLDMPQVSSDITLALRDLYTQMGQTQDGFPPLAFLNALRTTIPHFAEKAKNGHGYAQQDAEEAWSRIVEQLRLNLRIKDSKDTSKETTFVDKYMAGGFSSVTECDEQAAKDLGEEPFESESVFLKLDCHISGTTNHLRDGILAGLEEKLEKHSAILDRNAVYTKKSKISRLPKYLTVHFVRFFWKKEAQKKAKIMRKVTFPDELDIVEFCTDELKKMLIPVRDKVREIRKDEEDIERARKRQKRMHDKALADEAAGIVDSVSESKKVDNKKKGDGKDGKSASDGDVEMEGVVYKTDAEVDAEKAAAILEAKKELHAMIHPDLLADDGANMSGLYELRGIITHQGASADSGHYTSYVKKQGPLDPKTGKRGEEDGNWWWFNDDKVSEVEPEKIVTLSGGGESHSALILLYRAIPLPTAAGLADEAASTYNSRFGKTIQQIIEQIQKHRQWLGVDWVEESAGDEDEKSPPALHKAVRLLDYACGTGLVSRALAPYITQSIGVDLTEGMVNEYNTSARNQGISESEMYAVQGNLINAAIPNPPELAGEEFFGFDIAAVGLGFHHFDDPALAAKRLAERLKKGGVLMIVDFLPHSHVPSGSGDHSHKAAHTVTHNGFAEVDVQKIFAQAGVGANFDYKVIGKGIVFSDGDKKMERSVFFAKGVKL
ncbi:ubiquitin carboxyl-terminal hydrolase 14 [Diplocarpon rosae]|nr:ubiquitin carboxyl-terminal hydrolase 14 [Diplocarpon rosae]